MKLSLLPPSLISFLLLSLSIGPETTTARRSSSNLSTFTLRSDPSPPSNFKRQDPYDASFPSLPSTMGMIYPDPSETLYAGQTISIGFLDPPAAQNETLAGVFRLVTPTLTYSNRTTVVLEPWGSLSMTAPPDSYYPPRPRQGWCTVTLFPRDVHVRNFLIPTGLEDDQVRFSLNVTWGLPSYNGDDKSTNCSNPAQLYKAFFLSHLLQISPVPPVSSPVPLFPGTPPSPSLTTTFAALSTLAPPNVPAKVDHTHDGEKRNFAALGAVLGLGVVAAVLVVYWAARRKRRWIAAGGEDPDY